MNFEENPTSFFSLKAVLLSILNHKFSMNEEIKTTNYFDLNIFYRSKQRILYVFIYSTISQIRASEVGIGCLLSEQYKADSSSAHFIYFTIRMDLRWIRKTIQHLEIIGNSIFISGHFASDLRGFTVYLGWCKMCRRSGYCFLCIRQSDNVYIPHARLTLVLTDFEILEISDTFFHSIPGWNQWMLVVFVASLISFISDVFE